MVQTIKTISFTKELDDALDELVNSLNKRKIEGAITKSKIIRIAVIQLLDKQEKIKQILEDPSEVCKIVDEINK